MNLGARHGVPLSGSMFTTQNRFVSSMSSLYFQTGDRTDDSIQIAQNPIVLKLTVLFGFAMLILPLAFCPPGLLKELL